MGHVDNCTWCSKGSDFKTINVIYSLCHSDTALLKHFKKGIQNTMHRVMTQGVFQKVKGQIPPYLWIQMVVKREESSVLLWFRWFGLWMH